MIRSTYLYACHHNCVGSDFHRVVIQDVTYGASSVIKQPAVGFVACFPYDIALPVTIVTSTIKFASIRIRCSLSIESTAVIFCDVIYRRLVIPPKFQVPQVIYLAIIACCLCYVLQNLTAIQFLLRLCEHKAVTLKLLCVQLNAYARILTHCINHVLCSCVLIKRKTNVRKRYIEPPHIIKGSKRYQRPVIRRFIDCIMP